MLKIYGVPISVHTRKVIVTAIEKQLRYRERAGHPLQSRRRAGQELSPTGKIPVLADGDLVLRGLVGDLHLPGP